MVCRGGLDIEKGVEENFHAFFMLFLLAESD
jgi:hypothetical protein